MFGIPAWIIIIILLNAAVVLVYFSSDINYGTLLGQASPATSNNAQSKVTKTVDSTKVSNATSKNASINTSVYTTACVNSINKYMKGLNMSAFKINKTLYFNNSDDAISYLKNHSSKDYELMGSAKDVFALNESVISLDEFGTEDGRNMTLPIVCNKTGWIGSYSSCSLTNASNITYFCHNLTQEMSECDLEELNHGYWDDITYWITPNPGTLNLTQKFNFTIVSSRNRLEYASMFIDYERPNINKNLFNKSVATIKGDRISITATLNMTGKTFGGVKVTTYFKKKCYRYTILSQYMYG